MSCLYLKKTQKFSVLELYDSTKSKLNENIIDEQYFIEKVNPNKTPIKRNIENILKCIDKTKECVKCDSNMIGCQLCDFWCCINKKCDDSIIHSDDCLFSTYNVYTDTNNIKVSLCYKCYVKLI